MTARFDSVHLALSSLHHSLLLNLNCLINPTKQSTLSFKTDHYHLCVLQHSLLGGGDENVYLRKCLNYNNLSSRVHLSAAIVSHQMRNLMMKQRMTTKRRGSFD